MVKQKYNVSAGNDKLKVNYDLKKWGEVNNLSASANPPTSSAYQYSQYRNHKENIGIGYNITDNLSFEYNHMILVLIITETKLLVMLSSNGEKPIQNKIYFN